MIRTLLLTFVLAVAAFCQGDGVAGKWTYTMETPGGPMPVTLDLKVEGKTVTGTVAAGERQLNIENGTLDGKALSVTVKRQRDSGGTMVYDLKATLAEDGKTLKGTTSTDMDGQKVTQEWEAKRL